MKSQITQDMRPDVRAVFDSYPVAARAPLIMLRELIFNTAADHPHIGSLTETLKWGEPSYTPSKPRTGTAIRIAWKSRQPDTISLFVNCKTTLIETWRERFGDEFTFAGNREIVLPLTGSFPKLALTSCIHDALTYHVRKA